ncbi:flippase [Candidatus Woesearchaeota archaeon]|nr:flippase [Candidatus Woesearchaeota archaeon]
MSYTKKAVKGFSIVFIVNVIAAFLGYLIRIALARNLTVAEYGLFFAVFTLINFVALFHNLGLGQALVKFIPEFLVKKRYADIKNSITIALAGRCITIIILAVLLATFSGFLAEKYFKTPLAVPVILLFIFILFFENLRSLLRYIYQSFQKMIGFAIIYLVENIAILVLLLVFFIFIKKNIFSAVYAHLATYILVTLLFTIPIFKFFNFSKYRLSIKKDLIKKILKFGVLVVLIGVGAKIIIYTDTLILTYFRNLEEVGIYNAVVPTVMMILFFTTSVSSVILPLISELWTKKRKDYLASGLKVLEKYTFAVVFPVILAVFAFSRLVLSLMFGAEYAAGDVTMQVLLIGILFMAMFSIYSTVFSGIGRPGISTKILLQGALINFVLNLLIIPKLGMLGAAITSLITYFYVFLISVFKLRKIIKVTLPWLNWGKTTLAGFFMLFLILLLKKIIFMNVYLEAVLVAVIAGIVYLCLIFTLKVADLKELKEFLRHVF